MSTIINQKHINNKPLNILFFTTTSAYTGSEIVLSNIIHNINSSNIKSVAWISYFKGELIEKNRKTHIPHLVIYESVRSIWFWALLIPSIFKNKRYFSSLKSLYSLYINISLDYAHKKFKSDIWYINTILQKETLKYAYNHQIPCIVHAHELEQMLPGLNKQESEILVNYPQLIIACSHTAAQTLQILGRSENIEICYPTIDTQKIDDIKFYPEVRRQILGISPQSFVWCMSGTLDQNKNPIKFIEIAQKILNQGYDCHFLWLGNNSDSALDVFCKKYSEKLGLDNKIIWLGLLKNDEYYQYLNVANGFVLTSSRESFSIVSLEALYLQKPIVSFDCGGINEILTSPQIGKIVKSWNTDEIVEAMKNVMDNQFKFNKNLAKEIAQKFSIENQMEQWQKIIEKYFLKMNNPENNYEF
ncbi:glycosyltransferase [Synechocystis sp. FACHB-383]|uniref:glycosyltransferase n=1 Tax=Synechocystis sp. FACHB-383 TaxID=2692864 RepID=UPI001683B77D|nr:glycosyltransferase [Synechocystis sp. FACHB-383]MBD2655383.1 glycosyltransferase [Synechocystis sp. FACHB-383]